MPPRSAPLAGGAAAGGGVGALLKSLLLLCEYFATLITTLSSAGLLPTIIDMISPTLTPATSATLMNLLLTTAFDTNDVDEMNPSNGLSSSLPTAALPLSPSTR